MDSEVDLLTKFGGRKFLLTIFVLVFIVISKKIGIDLDIKETIGIVGSVAGYQVSNAIAKNKLSNLLK